MSIDSVVLEPVRRPCCQRVKYGKIQRVRKETWRRRTRKVCGPTFGCPSTGDHEMRADPARLSKIEKNGFRSDHRSKMEIWNIDIGNQVGIHSGGIMTRELREPGVVVEYLFSHHPDHSSFGRVCRLEGNLAMIFQRRG